MKVVSKLQSLIDLLYCLRNMMSNERHGRIGSTLKMNSRHKDKKIVFEPKSLRPFLRIVYVVDDSHIHVQIAEGASRAIANIFRIIANQIHNTDC